MRRIERIVTDEALIDEIIQASDCLRIALNDETIPYIVPVNFGFEHTEKGRFFYCHGAEHGRKINLIKKNGVAGFELDTHRKLVESEVACGHSYLYQSVIGGGKISLVLDEKEKIRILQIIMAHYTQKNEWEFPKDAALAHVSVIQLEVAELCCKSHQ